MATNFPRQARKEDPTGWMVVQDNLNRLRDVFDAYVSGVVAPPPVPTLPMYVAGLVDVSGSVISGAGFSCVRTGTGIYDITFTTPFASAPAIFATAVSGDRMETAPTSTTTGCEVRFVNASVALVNNGFYFMAYQMS